MQLSGKKVAIDLGTSYTRIMVGGQKEIVEEPTLVALIVSENKVLSVGKAAQLMEGKLPKGVEMKHPVEHGGISNFRAAEALLKFFSQKLIGGNRFWKASCVIGIPSDISSVEQRAIVQALSSGGIGNISLLASSFAAALGAELPVHESNGNLIMAIGSGVTEVAVISLNGLVAVKTIRQGSNSINEGIVEYIKNRYDLVIGGTEAERVKRVVGVADRHFVEGLSESMQIKGRSRKEKLPKTVSVEVDQLAEPIFISLKPFISLIQNVLEITPPDVVTDIIERGLVLAGGGAKLQGIDQLLTSKLNLPVHVVDEPDLAVIKGLGLAMDKLTEVRLALKK